MPNESFWVESGGEFEVTGAKSIRLYDIGSDVAILITPVEIPPVLGKVLINNRQGTRRVKVIMEKGVGILHIYDPIYETPSAGVVATHGGVAAGHGGIAIKGNVYGDVAPPIRHHASKIIARGTTVERKETYLVVAFAPGIECEVENIGGKIKIHTQ